MSFAVQANPTVADVIIPTMTRAWDWMCINPLWTLLALLATFIFFTWPLALPPKTPGPAHNVPYFGAMFEVVSNLHVLPDYVVERNREYGWVTWAGRMPNLGLLSGLCIFINSPENVKYVLHDNFENYVKGNKVAMALREFLGDGIFVADGTMWKTHRKVASNMFSRRLLRESCCIANDFLGKLLAHLREQSGKPVDAQELFFKLTIDIFTFIAFGVDLNSLGRDGLHPFARAFDSVQLHSEKRFYNPLWFLCKVLRLTQGEREITRGVAVMNAFANEVINTKRRKLAVHESLGPDLLSRFLENAEKNGEQLTDKELRDIVMNFMIAGRDTTACALSWTMFELLDKPDVQAKIREEFNLLCGQAVANGKQPTLEMVGEMRYMHAVAQEVLRLHPSVPKDVKFSVKRDVLPDGTQIPANASIIYTPYAMGRDPNLWDEPLAFKPERFIGVPEPSPFKYPVFNAGYRICLGKPLAMMEIKLVTATLLHHFDIGLAKQHPGTYQPTLVLPMNPGLTMTFTPRVHVDDA